MGDKGIAGRLCSLCGKKAKSRCAGCKRVFYCCVECQRGHWGFHKKECKFYQQTDKDYKAGKVLSEQEQMMKKHQAEFGRIVKEYGLDKGSKADELSAFLTDPANVNITPAMMKGQFGLEEGDAKTFLSWIQLGVTFKKEHLDGNQEILDQLKADKVELTSVTKS
eukprot:m.165779 g.165779  ORF g.165779 m.165779 type:complete len:165 (+) comp24017_c0_seq1:68-562(+)